MARWRNWHPQTGTQEGVPDWIRNAWTNEGVSSEGGEQRWSSTGNYLDPATGRYIMEVNPDGTTGNNGVRLRNPGSIREHADLGWVTDADNIDDSEARANSRRRGLRAAALMGGGFAAGSGLLGGLGASTLPAELVAEEAALTGSMGAGSAAFNPAVSAAAGAGAGAAARPDSYWGMVADSGQIASDASSGGLFGPGGGLDPETLAGLGGGGSAPSGASLGWQNFVSDPLGYLGRQAGRLPETLWSMARNDPMGATRAGLGLFSMLGGGNSGGGPGGPEGSFQLGPPPQFTPWMPGMGTQSPGMGMPQQMPQGLFGRRRRVPFMSGG